MTDIKKEGRDQQIAEITKNITSTLTDKEKISILQTQVLEIERLLLEFKNEIVNHENQIQRIKNDYDFFYKESLEKRKGIKLLVERINEKIN